MISQHAPGRSNWSLRRYNVSKTSVSFRYQLWHICDLLSWLVSCSHQLVGGYYVSNWSVFSMYQWDVAKTYQLGPSHSRTSCDVLMRTLYGRRRPDHYVVACRVGYFLTLWCFTSKPGFDKGVERGWKIIV